MEIEKKGLKAVHDENLPRLLQELRILDPLTRGELLCKFCRDTVDMQNLHSLFPESGSIKVVCDKRECIAELSTYLRESKVTL